MLELRPICEHCAIPLPNGDANAMICSFECTFCKNCVQNILQSVCPNCGGGFENRSTRPLKKISEYPAETKHLHKPIIYKDFQEKLNYYKNILPHLR
jgi:hypothetical protein